ncbi:type IX secretion system PorP/SprF family membrane protein [Dysgonomonas alginatilytica]|uniref:Type IX secretion system PorP/SprF family membrane protein n=1 Tax=Dysgonomonas alginatilytica TaxID=1605892 RepID=A0A2V3PLK2_9BACT|nr:type IX secretion system membrane protein PorP/SprF [Dysgonomonas alginatilytica]PXV62792.1 type IX secretion system PorP/SprF family membrane protein [Dysgonomonas alginatilytica]
MKFGYILLALLISFCFSLDLKAQWDGQVSQYWKVKTFFNPAFAAEKDSIQATLLHRQQWVGIENAPKTFILSADMPISFLGRKHGVGIVALTESSGLFKNTSVGAQYVYKKRFKRNLLNVGVQAGFLNIGFDASKIRIPDSQKEDGLEIPSVPAEARVIDGNIGLAWVAPRYYIGISLTHITQPTFELDDGTATLVGRVYYFTAGYNLRLRNPLYELQPSVLVKTDNVVTQYDVTARVVYNKMFNGGISWRKDDGFVFLLGINIFGVDAGYAYDLSTSEIALKSGGSHEFFVRYAMPIKLAKNGQNRHKSVRIL